MNHTDPIKIMYKHLLAGSINRKFSLKSLKSSLWVKLLSNSKRVEWVLIKSKVDMKLIHSITITK